MDIPAKAPLVYISFSADVNLKTTESLIQAMSHCANLQVQKVCLLISTTGGITAQGLNLYNVLKGMPFELTTNNVGSVNSIGNVVFLAGTKRLAAPSTTFMFHGVGYTLQQGQRLEQRDLQEKLDGILADQKRIGDIIASNTNLTEEQIAGLFKETQTKDVNFALEKRIIHEIAPAQIIGGSPIISLVGK